ncbi:MAG: HU family DNA-binding protein [Desulfovibrio sp.]|nr:HU family DNA-binding protein [Desulfovibrio sp.]
MNQTELKKAVAESSGISRDTVERCFESLRSVALRELQKGGEVPLPGLGKIFVKQRAERMGRNPRTGAPMTIPACMAAKFSLFKPLRDELKKIEPSR